MPAGPGGRAPGRSGWAGSWAPPSWATIVLVIVDCAVYTKGERRPGTLDLDAAIAAAHGDPESFVWVGLHEPTEREFDDVVGHFDLHPLAVEDAIHAHQRPKLELYGDMLFVVVKTARYDDVREAVELSEVLVFAGEGFVVTVRHGEASALATARERLESDPAKLALGPIAAVHAVVDHIVDDYGPVLDGLDKDIAEIEAQVFSPQRTNSAARIYRLKRQVLDMYRNVDPLLEPLERLQQGRHPYAHVELGHYFRDVADHLHRVLGRIDIQRQLLTDVLDVNTAQIQMQQNDDMRTIAGWVAIAAVPTMLAAVWGMNFRNMPELDEPWAYPAAIGLMVLIAVVLFRYLHRRGWI